MITVLIRYKNDCYTGSQKKKKKNLSSWYFFYKMKSTLCTMVLYANLVSSIIQMWLLMSDMSAFVLPPESGSARGPSAPPDCWVTSIRLLLALTHWGTCSHLLGAAVFSQSILPLDYPSSPTGGVGFYWGDFRGLSNGLGSLSGRSSGCGFHPDNL